MKLNALVKCAGAVSGQSNRASLKLLLDSKIKLHCFKSSGSETHFYMCSFYKLKQSILLLKSKIVYNKGKNVAFLCVSVLLFAILILSSIVSYEILKFKTGL